MTVVGTKIKSRKARRKEERAKKKENKKRHQQHRRDAGVPVATTAKVDDENKAKTAKRRKEPRTETETETKSKIARTAASKNDPYATLDPDVAAALRREDEEIAQLEAKLGIASSKKEKSRLHKEYAEQECYGDDFGDFLDDLDHLTARISSEPGSSRDDEEYEPILKESSGHHEGDSAGFQSDSDEQSEESVPMKGPSYDPDHDVDVEDDGDAGTSSSDEDESDGDADHHDREADHDVNVTYQPSRGEDIYGRELNDSGGSVESKRYVPPHLRKTNASPDDNDPSREESLRAVRRTLNNSLNRLSEDAFVPVVQSISGLYASHAAADVNECIWENARQACVDRSTLVTGLVPIYVAALTGVHVGRGESAQLGEYLMEVVIVELFKELETARTDDGQVSDVVANDAGLANKRISNLMLVLCYLYNFSIIHCSLMFDVIRDLIESFAEIDVELLLLILMHCGRSLRSDDPSALKEIVLLVHKRAARPSDQFPNSSRVEYMVSAIDDLKNNKRRKQDTVYADKVNKLRKLLGQVKSAAVASNGSFRVSDSSLRVSLQDILNAERKGRWWKVGASWVGNQYRFHDGDEPADAPSKHPESASIGNVEENTKLLRLAAKYRMNTDTRRSIFCIIMGSADCEDAFEKLVRGGMLKNRMERETVRVLMECCGNEKTYNKFYSHLASRICAYQLQCKFTLQLAFWDTFKVFDDLKDRKVANLAKLLFHLVVVHRTLKLNVLKAIDMSSPEDLPEAAMIFLTIFFSSLLDHFDDATDVKELFLSGVSTPQKESPLKGDKDDDLDYMDDADGLRANLSIFLTRVMKASPKYKKGSKYRSNLKAAVKVCNAEKFL